MQIIAFPDGILLARESSGHDGLFLWSTASYWGREGNVSPIPARVVPGPVYPQAIRSVPCPNCDHPEYFIYLNSQLKHHCQACLHVFAVLTIPSLQWYRVKSILSEHNPWVNKSYREVIPSYAGGPIVEEYDNLDPEKTFESHNWVITTATRTGTNDAALTLLSPLGP